LHAGASLLPVQAFLGSYAVIIGLVLLVVLFTLINCPAGVCFGSLLLNTALLAFSALPLLMTVGMLLMRDTCGNLEQMAVKAVAHKAGNSSLPTAVSQFYLNSGAGNSTAGLPEIIKGINAEYDVEGFKARVQQSVDEMLKGVTDDFTLRPQVVDCDSKHLAETASAGHLAAVLQLRLSQRSKNVMQQPHDPR
jgi:hypothetical protein